MHMFWLVEEKKLNMQADCDIISPFFAGICIRLTGHTLSQETVSIIAK